MHGARGHRSGPRSRLNHGDKCLNLLGLGLKLLLHLLGLKLKLLMHFLLNSVGFFCLFGHQVFELTDLCVVGDNAGFKSSES